ncbi:hypothetical protein ES705_29638 [subsurface metagenome]
MSRIKRRIKRQQRSRKNPLEIDVYVEDGDINVIMSSGNWFSGTGVLNTGLSDCELPLLSDKIGDRIEQSGPCSREELLCIADQVIKEEKQSLLDLAKKQSRGGSPGS